MKKLAAIGALVLFPGCVAMAQQAGPAAPAEAGIERVAETLVRGHKALASNGSAQVLADASTRLQDLGAKPADDNEADRARDWLAEARKRGLETETAPFRGRVLGPAYRSGSLAPGEASETSQLFLAGEQAEVVAIPVESTTLQLEIVEGEGQRNCTPPPTSARSVCRWIPIFTSRYQIRVRNIGERPSAFYLVTN
ncbi:hypothetical protein [Aurantiacibacter odishensis]|uniref:hypothetical protein n=1 Tax=Aurantiacibacter odishensis TaxID=1155476 RepID=UPI000E754DEB|nr:hypothetical protein [Aurantiacibacter odishensis]